MSYLTKGCSPQRMVQSVQGTHYNESLPFLYHPPQRVSLLLLVHSPLHFVVANNTAFLCYSPPLFATANRAMMYAIIPATAGGA
ncbi:uncharacterized protein G2W53_004245 [Senna tora]|uniref:Uncharacterized protein n=1 Tax=Senna tora TaxID=362788 RepID=A0A834XC00_9FABA|nr:uncharacterized protein G2W53_004245 [Senna tora]